MKIDEIPQYEGGLGSLDVVCYAVDDEGKYTTGISSGWELKAVAFEAALSMVDEQTEEARKQVLAGTRSPIVYYMAKNRMDWGVLAGYMNMWKFLVKRHGKPTVFNRLSDKILSRYADIFAITIDELKDIKLEHTK